MDFKTKLVAAISKAGIDAKLAEQLLEVPAQSELGDFALPCFKLAAQFKKNPAQIAAELKEKIRLPPEFTKAEVKGPYINFYLNEEKIAGEIIAKTLSEKGTKKKKPKEKIVVEYCQANPMKAFHIGHVRNIVTGEAIAKLFEANGQNVVRIDYGGDVGPHVSKTIYAYRNLEHPPEPDGIAEKEKWIGNLYTAGAKAVSENPELEEKMRQMVVALENGSDKQLARDWAYLRKLSLNCFSRIFDELGTKFDRIILESEVEKEGIKIAKELEKQGFAVKDQGAILVDLEKCKLGKFLILKSDGAALYSSKDLGLARLKKKELKASHSYNVVGAEQTFYFQQLTKTIELLNKKKPDYCPTTHIAYELVRLEGGKMSSREGNVITYTELFDEMIAKTLSETRQRHPDWKEEKIVQTAKKLALAAIKFGMLNHDRNKVIAFNWERATSLEGETGPFVLYTYARGCSILRKAGKTAVPEEFRFETESEKIILQRIGGFEQALSESINSFSPQKLCIYLLELCSAFNTFYQNVQVLQAEPGIRESRLALVLACTKTIEKGLKMLNIGILEEM